MKKEYQNLQDEIFVAKCDLYTDFIDKKRSKNKKAKIKKLLKHLIPSIILTTSFLIFKHPISIFLTLLYENTLLIKDYINKQEKKKTSRTQTTNKVINFTDMKENMILKITNSFQNQQVEFSEEINESENVNIKKYNAALKEQQKRFYFKKNSIIKRSDHHQPVSSNNTKAIEHSQKYEQALKKQKKQIKLFESTKNEAIIDIFDEISMHRLAYKIPPIIIQSHEWHKYFNTIYDYLEAKNATKYFYEDSRYVVRYTLVKAILKDSHYITYQDLIDNIYYLLHRGYKKNEIDQIKTLLEKEKDEKVILFKKYTK